MPWAIPHLTQLKCWEHPFFASRAESHAQPQGQRGLCPPARTTCLGPRSTPDLLVASPLHTDLNTQVRYFLFFPSLKFYNIKAACWNTVGLRFPPEIIVLKDSNQKGLIDSYFSGFKKMQQVRLSTQNTEGKSYMQKFSLVKTVYLSCPAFQCHCHSAQSVVNNWLGGNLSTNTSWQNSFNTRLAWKCKQLVLDLVVAIKKPGPSDAPEH